MAILADRVELLVLVENWVDMLLPDRLASESDSVGISRAGLIHHFDPKLVPPQAENGISILVTATLGSHTTSVLFDVGLTGKVLAHNLDALAVDANLIDQIVVSHGHPDHYGGIFGLLELMQHDVPVVTHPDAFLPRYAVMGDGRTAPFYNAAFQPQSLAESRGRVVLTREPVELGWGLITTGEISRSVEFEGPRPPAERGAPGLYQVDQEGSFRLDEVWDEQALVINVRGEGLVVLTGCSHAGVINTIHRAADVSGQQRIRAVLGGFHLGFPTTPPENVGKTLAAMQELDVEAVMPMHCSGLRCQAAFSSELGPRYIQPAVGTVLHFGRT